MMLAMFDVASPLFAGVYFILMIVAPVLLIAAVLTAVIFAVKTAKSKKKETDPSPQKDASAE